MWEFIIFIAVLWGGIWLISKFVEWIQKKREAIRDKVADELLANIDIGNDIEKYKKKLNYIDYKRENPVERILHYYNVKEHGSFADFFSNLGHCPQCKEGNLQVRIGRYGKFIGCSKYPKCQYSKNIKTAKLHYREKLNKQIINEIQRVYSP